MEIGAIHIGKDTENIIGNGTVFSYITREIGLVQDQLPAFLGSVSLSSSHRTSLLGWVFGTSIPGTKQFWDKNVCVDVPVPDGLSEEENLYLENKEAAKYFYSIGQDKNKQAKITQKLRSQDLSNSINSP
ncbi:hypothetical protein DFA_03738 [Cavenderia fasciculata]|uniref:Uncharacterized protein n=1 Tax=Cavenderia fasciculata TaxID=261658 RepID=F4Q0A0_CACFS|nr:uncharacterized protein DFA_03738 [Cavenderia fasciculata]EGG18251.1 hypothetical protein DFA_03738 [Cavenderia fasciculata]|eukprot:XP_004357074.1 hypothetical protein DFA_03738 [Cavenderia fasciculata]